MTEPAGVVTYPGALSDRVWEWIRKKRPPGYVCAELGGFEADVVLWRDAVEKHREALRRLLHAVENQRSAAERHDVDLPGCYDAVRLGKQALASLSEMLEGDE